MELNQLLDSLLHQVRAYYRDDIFKADIDRATLMYVGPEYEEKTDKNLFWQGFWDFFLFDYHLLDTDAIPLRHYYEQKKEGMTSSEQDVLRDLLRSEFTVFSIVSFDEEFVTCQNLFTDECMNCRCRRWHRRLSRTACCMGIFIPVVSCY